MDFNGLVFNFHDYCGLRSGVTGNPTDLIACADQELRTMQRRSDERPDLATPKQPEGPAWFMSEFGATTSNALMDRLTRIADELQLGWTYWQWKYYDDPTGSSAEALVTPDGTAFPDRPVVVPGLPPGRRRHPHLVLLRPRQSASSTCSTSRTRASPHRR